MKTVVIRPACPKDIDNLVVVEATCFSHDRLSRRSFRRFVSPGSHLLLLAEDGHGDVLGYALLLFRKGTARARLYSIAVMPRARRHGTGGRLLAAAEAAAIEHGAMSLRLEVHINNRAVAQWYRRKGYRELSRLPQYYEDHGDGLRFEKRLRPLIIPEAIPCPYYAQTTEFTCGPACVLMALSAFGIEAPADRKQELLVWRQATTIYMTAGHGGCGPLGLAVALASRGLDIEVFVSRPGPYFLEGVRDEDKREIMRLSQESFAEEASRLGIPVTIRGLSAAQLAERVAGPPLAITLISGYRMLNDRSPHWIMVHAAFGRHLVVHDPWIDPDRFESAEDARDLPIPFAEFDRMATYGAGRLQAAIIIKGRRPQ